MRHAPRSKILQDSEGSRTVLVVNCHTIIIIVITSVFFLNSSSAKVGMAETVLAVLLDPVLGDLAVLEDMRSG